MRRHLTIEVQDCTGDVGTSGPCYRARGLVMDRTAVYGGCGRTPLEAVAEVLRHADLLSAVEYAWERKTKIPGL